MLLNNYIEKNINKIRHDYLFDILDDMPIDYKAFFISCAIEDKCEIIETIINENYIDVKYCDENNTNGLMIACKLNENLEVIQYLSNFIDVNDINYFGETCFLYSCFNNSVKVVKYLVETLKADICHDNGILLACQYNTNINIINYLHQYLKFNLNSVNVDGENCFLKACYENNLNVIQYLSHMISKEGIYLADKNGHHAFYKACGNNKNIDVLEFLINELHFYDNDSFSCFLNACRRNTLDVVKFLINNNDKSVENYYDLIFENSCGNDDVSILKFFIEELKIKIQKEKTYSRGFNHALISDQINIMKYLIEFIRINIYVQHRLPLYDDLVRELGQKYLLDSNYIIYTENVYVLEEYITEIKLRKILNKKQKKIIKKIKFLLFS